MSKKEKFPLYLSPEKKATLERRYTEDGSRSITGFIENAIDFYLDYLSANNSGLFLPSAYPQAGAAHHKADKGFSQHQRSAGV